MVGEVDRVKAQTAVEMLMPLTRRRSAPPLFPIMCWENSTQNETPSEHCPASTLVRCGIHPARESVHCSLQVGAPSVPDVRWEDIGGLEAAKRALLDTVELPLRRPELFAAGLRRRSGVLLYGPPGGCALRACLRHIYLHIVKCVSIL